MRRAALPRRRKRHLGPGAGSSGILFEGAQFLHTKRSVLCSELVEFRTDFHNSIRALGSIIA